MTLPEKWTCVGSVCGECGIIHRSHRTAALHCGQHDAAIRRANGSNAYSDRYPEPQNAAAKATAQYMRQHPEERE